MRSQREGAKWVRRGSKGPACEIGFVTLCLPLVLNRLHLMLLHSQIGEKEKEPCWPPSISITLFIYFPWREIKEKKEQLLQQLFEWMRRKTCLELLASSTKTPALLSCRGAFQLKKWGLLSHVEQMSVRLCGNRLVKAWLRVLVGNLFSHSIGS